MNGRRFFLLFCLVVLATGCARGGTYALYLRYDPVKELSSLQQKLGATMGLTPFKDNRPEKSLIGVYWPLGGKPYYFTSQPFPLEKALWEAISQTLSQKGIKVVPRPEWGGDPDSLGNVETDSIMNLEIKQFWSEANASLFTPRILTRVSFVIHLGVKKEGRVFTRKVDLEKEMSFPIWEWDREQMARTVNQVLATVFDEFFSNPY